MHPESNESLNPNPNPAISPPPADERLLRLLRGQQRRLGWLTAIAVGFWTLAVVASVGVLICFAVFYAPKEKQIMLTAAGLMIRCPMAKETTVYISLSCTGH